MWKKWGFIFLKSFFEFIKIIKYSMVRVQQTELQLAVAMLKKYIQNGKVNVKGTKPEI